MKTPIANVVAISVGTLDLTGVTLQGYLSATSPRIDPEGAVVRVGPAALATLAEYSGFTGPTTFGSGFLTLAPSGSGTDFMIIGHLGEILVPSDYVSGSALAGTATFTGQTLSCLGATPGTYVYSGPAFGIIAGDVFVPMGYVSGNSISSTATWSGQTIASMGLTPGTYVYTSNYDTYTVNIASVPEPASWALMLLGFTAIGLTVRRRSRPNWASLIS